MCSFSIPYKIIHEDIKRVFNNLENGLNKIGFNENEVNDILGNNWFEFYKEINL